MLYPGNKAPDLRLETIEGQGVDLADIWQNGHNVLLVFLRHLG